MSDLLRMSDVTMTRAMAVVRAYTGVALTDAKRSMLEGRLRSRVSTLGLSSFESYLDHLDIDPQERERFIDVVTTHQTQFFRTPRLWEYLAEDFLRARADEESGGCLQAWSAATSTGEEAWSVAVCCEEARLAQQRRGRLWEYRILASDISRGVLATAATGRYEGVRAASFRQESPTRFAAFNAATEPDVFVPSPALRQRVRFEQVNLLQPVPTHLPTFDLVLLRNVLIYFTPQDVETVVRHVTSAMKPGGLLCIGESESLNGLDLPLEFVRPQIYRRRTRAP